MNEIEINNCKEILSKLLKSQLEDNLIKCEKSTSQQLNILTTSKTTVENSINNILKMEKSVNNYLKEKEEKLKKTRNSKSVKKDKKSILNYLNRSFDKIRDKQKNIYNKNEGSMKRSKTCANLTKIKKSNNNLEDKTVLSTRKENATSIRRNSQSSNGNDASSMMTRSKMHGRKKTPFKVKNIFISDFNKNQISFKNNKSMYKNDNTSIYSGTTSINSVKRNVINKNKNKDNYKENKRLKNKSKSKPKINYNNHNIKSSKNLTSTKGGLEEFNISKILSIETTIDRDDLLIKNLNDIELDQEETHMLGLEHNLIDNNNLKNNYFFNIDEFLTDENFNVILDYLKLKDYIQIKNVNKEFHNIILNKIKENFEEEKKQYELKINNVNDVPEKYDLKNIKLTQSTEKAINLLNGKLLNKIFLEEEIPCNDVLLIYKLYFYIINNDIKKINNKGNFWKKTCNYFMGENQGKTGNLIKNIIDNKIINITDYNLYKIVRLLNNKLNIIIPSYFSKICGTTGLFVFFIKDILDFIGISNDKNAIPNSYWTYSKVINYISQQINVLQLFKYFK